MTSLLITQHCSRSLMMHSLRRFGHMQALAAGNEDSSLPTGSKANLAEREGTTGGRVSS
jgi:hypothetical protein